MTLPEESGSIHKNAKKLVREKLFQDLSSVDIAILSVISKLNQEDERHPTTSVIQKELLVSHPLRRTQLYDRLAHLHELGFISADPFRRPRSYHIDKSTLESGSREWLRRQKESLEQLSNRIEDLLRTMENATPSEVARLVGEAVENNDGSEA
ncbi:MAG: hypothetical protein AM324_010650 [Candidatus Thorarchaeota archaeon SMTZ1-83]|nr:MAG: hypothetical protein AM324_11965 [Candidatus Thorarchaeota archaeon SMTZ1-83]